MSKKDNEKTFINIPENAGSGPSWVAIAATGLFQMYPIFAFLLFLKLRRMWQNSRLEKYRTYARAIGNSLAISIKELAKTVGKPRSEVRDDLAKMIAKGYLGPEAYVDHSRDMLYILRPAAEDVHAHSGHVNFDFSDLSDIVSDISGIAGEVAHTLKDAFKDTRNAFKDARQDVRTGHNYAPSGTRPEAHAEEAQKAGSDEYAEAQKTEYAAFGAYGDEAQKAEYAAYGAYGDEAQKAEYAAGGSAEAPKTDAADVDSGKSESEATLMQLKKLNDDIADEDVSNKIDRIAMLTGDIYAFVALNPERAGEVRKFMNYYLPTTMKLLTSYSLLERQSYQGENIINARKDIEKILETLVHAFEKQLDQLFATDAVDISSDIQVLETMMAKDGLSEEKKGYTLRL